MLLTGSDCFDVISDSFDSFFRDLHAFRPWPPPEIRQVEQKYYGKFESFGKEFRRIEVERVSTPSQVFWLNHLSTSWVLLQLWLCNAGAWNTTIVRCTALIICHIILRVGFLIGPRGFFREVLVIVEFLNRSMIQLLHFSDLWVPILLIGGIVRHPFVITKTARTALKEFWTCLACTMRKMCQRCVRMYPSLNTPKLLPHHLQNWK